MCHKTYGTIDPSPNDQPQKRATSLAYWKKAISYFMNSTSKWDEASQTGNLTQSKKVNNLVKIVRKAETRGNGVSSQADRSFTLSEFIQVLDLIGDPRYRAMMNYQFHLIGRCDDMAHIKKTTLKASLDFEGFLTGKISWSKNVYDETNSPTHLLLPSINTKFCVYMSLALWLEKWIADGHGRLSQWLFCDGNTTEASSADIQDREALKGMRECIKAIKSALDSNAFTPSTASGKLGSHSIRKFAVTTCRMNGVPKDDIDYRARWSVTRMQDRYTAIQLNWPDANAASKLSINGACKYVVPSSTGLSDSWLACRITPNITAMFGQDVGAILAKPLLWACFHSDWSKFVPPEVRNQIFSALRQRGRDPDEGNPVKRVEIIACECGGAVSLDEMIVENHEDNGGNDDVEPARARELTRDSLQWRATVYARLGTTQRTTAEIQVQVLHEFAEMSRRLRLIEQRLRTMAYEPARRIRNPAVVATRRGTEVREGDTRQGQDTRPATLCRNPKVLSVLWDEWVNGIGGSLPAKDFTPEQRGKCKAIYSQRKVFWDCMERQIDAGSTAASAIAKIEQMYPGPVSVKLKALRTDERRGGHNRLNPFPVDPNRRGRRGQLLRNQ